MRRLASALASTLASAALVSTLVASPASAQDIFDGGRLAGGSSQLIPTGSFSPGGALPEIDRPVDLGRYAGTWYQVAAIPQPYTLQCFRDTSATYGVVDSRTVSVRNSCGTLWGSTSSIEGTATVRSQASLRVGFPGVPFQNPNGPANYVVTYLEQDYSLAVVGDPNRASGFILSRNPSLTPQQWKKVRGIVESRGYNSCTFLTVPMKGGRGDILPLCIL